MADYHASKTGDQLMANHKQVEVYSPIYECMIEVDEGIAELIQLIWDLGLQTNNSCQENMPGIMWVSFPSEDAERFLTIMALRREEDFESDDPPSSMYGRIMDPANENSWDFRVCLDDLSEVLDEESDTIYHEGDSEIRIFVSIRFPVSDYDEVVDRLREFYEWVSEDDDQDSP